MNEMHRSMICFVFLLGIAPNLVLCYEASSKRLYSTDEKEESIVKRSVPRFHELAQQAKKLLDRLKVLERLDTGQVRNRAFKLGRNADGDTDSIASIESQSKWSIKSGYSIFNNIIQSAQDWQEWSNLMELTDSPNEKAHSSPTVKHVSITPRLQKAFNKVKPKISKTLGASYRVGNLISIPKAATSGPSQSKPAATNLLVQFSAFALCNAPQRLHGSRPSSPVEMMCSIELRHRRKSVLNKMLRKSSYKFSKGISCKPKQEGALDCVRPHRANLGILRPTSVNMRANENFPAMAHANKLVDQMGYKKLRYSKVV